MSECPSIDQLGDRATGAVGDDLRRAVQDGQLGLALLQAGPMLAVLADDDPVFLASLLRAAAESRTNGATGALVEADAIAFALTDSRGALIHGSERFQSWIPEPAESVDCRELASRAATLGRATGRVKTMRHGVLATIAIAHDSRSPWPEAMMRLGSAPLNRGVLMVVFAPSRSRVLVERAAVALGLSPLQREIAMALIDEPTLESAAARLRVGRETAKDALDGALKKAGVRRSSQLVGRLIDLSCSLADRDQPPGGAAAALGLTPGEAAVADRVADGQTVDEAAQALGLKPGTVKAYRRTIFEKLGINRSRDLRRLITESTELDHLSRTSSIDLGSSAAPDFDLIALTGADGREIACLDFGSPRGRPLLLLHGFFTGRLAPPPLVNAMAAKGYRVIVPQRPGFGLTSAARGPFLETAVNDMVAILGRLNTPKVSMLARDGAVATALAFGLTHPDRLDIGVLQNPKPPINSFKRARTALTAVSEMLLRHPALIDPYARMLIRQTSLDVLDGIFRRVFAAADVDSACYERPEVSSRLLSDLLGLVGRTVTGGIEEQRLFSEGWSPSAVRVGPTWRLAYSGRFYHPGDEYPWRSFSAGPPAVLAEGGWLIQYTHAPELAALFEP